MIYLFTVQKGDTADVTIPAEEWSQVLPAELQTMKYNPIMVSYRLFHWDLTLPSVG